MDEILEYLLSSNTETEVLEFKEAKTQYDKNKLGKYFSALCNEANLKGKNNAWLLFGIKNDQSIVGTNITDKQLNDYKSEISNNTSPTLNFINVHRINTKSGDVLMLEIPPAPRGIPVSWKGHYYGRDGESLGALNSEEYDRIRNQNIQEDWSAKIVKGASINDLSEEAIAVAREKFKEKSSKAKYYSEIDNWNIQTFLDKAKVTIKGKITNTAILLLGKEESSHYLLPSISEITWKLETEEKAYEHFSCPLLLNTSKVLKNIRNIKYKFFPNNELLATTVDKYDIRTILEAMHNCIAHQDYSLNSRIIVTEKIDKLIFSNAGSFFEGNPDDYFTGIKTPVKYRNPWLAKAMVNLGMIDTMGYGIYTMYTSQRERFFPLPDYIFSEPQNVVLNSSFAVKLSS